MRMESSARAWWDRLAVHATDMQQHARRPATSPTSPGHRRPSSTACSPVLSSPRALTERCSWPVASHLRFLRCVEQLHRSRQQGHTQSAVVAQVGAMWG